MNESSGLRRALELTPSVIVLIVVCWLSARSLDRVRGAFVILLAVGSVSIAVSTTLLDRLDRRRVASARSATPEAAGPAPDRVEWLRPTAALAPSVLSTQPVTTTSPKLDSPPDENEDYLAVDIGRGRFVVSDGAGSSFAAGTWSRALCESLVAATDPVGSDDDLYASIGAAAVEWKLSVTAPDEVPWWAQEGIRNGAFATVLVVQLVADGARRLWKAVAIGDSCVIHLRRHHDAWQLLSSFPIDRADEFTSSPPLVSSNTSTARLDARRAHGETDPGDVLLLVTDAVGEWLLGSPDRLDLACSADTDRLAGMFDESRRTRAMANDDATLIRLSL